MGGRKMKIQYSSLMSCRYCLLAIVLLVSCLSNCEASEVSPIRTYTLLIHGLLKPVRPSETVTLAPGDSVLIRVDARNEWNDTGIMLLRGIRYELTVLKPDEWYDAGFKVDAAGHANIIYRLYMTLFQSLKRVKVAPWFSLVGTVGSVKDSEAFYLGEQCPLVPRCSGRLLCFANDAWGFYWNNSGSIFLIIQRKEQ